MKEMKKNSYQDLNKCVPEKEKEDLNLRKNETQYPFNINRFDSSNMKMKKEMSSTQYLFRDNFSFDFRNVGSYSGFYNKKGILQNNIFWIHHMRRNSSSLQPTKFKSAMTFSFYEKDLNFVGCNEEEFRLI